MSDDVPMYIETVPNRNSPPAILLRESWREGKKTRKRTLANLSKWSEDKIDTLRAALKGGVVIGDLKSSFVTVRNLLHGHVAAALGTLRKLGLDTLIASKRSRERDLVLAMIVGRIIAPGSKLSLARGLGAETCISSLGHVLDIDDADQDELYGAMDWLLKRQSAIEKKLVERHLKGGSLVFYDVTSAHLEGRHCPLGAYGHPHGGPKGKLQINFGVLCDEEGRPTAVEVFEGNVGDPTTFTAQVVKMRERFGLERIVYVGDRGMITSARIREDLWDEHGIDWITALRADQIRPLIKDGAFQPSLFDQINLAEIEGKDYPRERLIVCRNPALAEERTRKRQELLDRTEEAFAEIAKATQRSNRPLRGKDKIALRVGKVRGRFKMSKHFEISITEEGFTYKRDQKKISEEAKLDGFYVVRTSVCRDKMEPEEVVRSYKHLSRVEQAFRMMKSIDLKVRPIFHHLEDRVRAHVFLCMLAYYVDWHMRAALAPILFEEDDPEAAEAQRADVVSKAQKSPSAQAKASSKRTEDGLPVHSFPDLLKHLSTLAISEHRPTIKGITDQTFLKLSELNPLQTRAFDLLGVRPSL
jgi:transposase